MTRKYELNKRARKQAETRRRIVEAAVALHEEVGPARTTITAIAARAGVERLTVYRHFATEDEIIHACSEHFEVQHPMPEATAWEKLTDPVESLTRGLEEIYRYYEEAAPMLTAVQRDADVVPALRDPVAQYVEHFEELAASLSHRWQPTSSAEEAREITAAIEVAIAFETWRILVQQQGYSSAEAATVAVKMVSGVREAAPSA